MVAPEPGAIHLRRIMNILRDRRQPGEDNDGRQRQDAPYIDDDDRCPCQSWLTKPDRPFVGPEQPDRARGPVDDAVNRIEDPEPTDAAKRDRRYPRQQD